MVPPRAGDVNGRIDALAQDEAVLIAVAIDVESYNRAGVVDPLRHGQGRAGHVDRGKGRTGHVDRGKVAFAQQETMAVTIRVT